MGGSERSEEPVGGHAPSRAVAAGAAVAACVGPGAWGGARGADGGRWPGDATGWRGAGGKRKGREGETNPLPCAPTPSAFTYGQPPKRRQQGR